MISAASSSFRRAAASLLKCTPPPAIFPESRAFLTASLRNFASQPHPTTAVEEENPYTDFSLTPEQTEFKNMAESFARQALAPHSSRWDAEHHFPVDVIREAAGLGFGGLYVSEHVGGSALGRADAAIIFEALSYGDVPVTAYLTIHNMVAGVLDKWCTEEQRQAFLPPLCSMDHLASYCLTEPGSGSDAAAMKTTAKKQGEEYVIDGAKAFISGGGATDIYLVMARTGDYNSGHKGVTAFLVEKGTPGLSFGKKEEKMGWNAQPTTAVMFDGVRVPAGNRIGREGEGFRIAMQALDGGRINIAACSLGGAAFALDVARDYVKSRKQFGRAVSEFQATQFKLADMATSLQASKWMVRQAAAALDAKSPAGTMQAAMAKRFATDACFDVANDALQLLGGYGYLKEYAVEQVVRDLRVHSILEGTNEVMRVIISRELEQLGK